jgi:hypothetical protein
MKIIREETTKKDIKDIKGWTIPKGTVLYIVKERKIKSPITNIISNWKLVRVDNGTGLIDCMPETCIVEKGV